jgi:hypothetical protein
MSKINTISRKRRIVALPLAAAMACVALSPFPARAEPITAAAALFFAGKAVLVKLGILKGAGAVAVPLAATTAVKTIAVNQTIRTVVTAQASRTVAARSAITMSQTTVAVASSPTAGITMNLTLSRGAVLALLSAAGLGTTTGSAAADDELVAELSVARSRGETQHRQLVCERANGTVYAVPSSWERCPSAGETLKALEQTLNPQQIR